MANKKTLKGYFETGDIPNQSQYHELINSNLNLNETGTQILVGTLSSSFLEVENHITASGNISSSGTIIANHITASGNISASGTITTSGVTIKGHLTGKNSGLNDSHLTAFTNIQGYGNFQMGNSTTIDTHIITGKTTFDGNITASGNISASGEVYAQQYFIENRSILDYSTSGELLRLGYNSDTETIKVGRNGVTTNGILLDANVTASGNISSSGTVIANLIQTPRINGTGGSLYIADPIYVAGGHITASGNISSSGEMFASRYTGNGGTSTFAAIANVNTTHITASGNLKIDGSQVDFTNLPTSDPGVAGRLYNDSGTIKISL